MRLLLDQCVTECSSFWTRQKSWVCPSPGNIPMTCRLSPSQTRSWRQLLVLRCYRRVHLQWSQLVVAHWLGYICPSGSKRLYFLSMLKRAGASQRDLLMFYKAAVRSVVEYACVVWHTGLTGEQSNRIESIPKRAVGIILPDVSYELALVQREWRPYTLAERNRPAVSISLSESPGTQPQTSSLAVRASAGDLWTPTIPQIPSARHGHWQGQK